jgi:hypothetical protein
MEAISIFQYILYGLELTTCITGFFFWRKIKTSFWRWFPFYLVFIVVTEQTGNYLNFLATNEAADLKNRMISYLIVPVEFLFFYIMYYVQANSPGRKRLVVFCIAIFIFGFIADLLYFKDKEFLFSSFSYCIGNLSLLIVIISFFIQFVSSSELINFKSSFIFWVSAGLLIFYLGTLPFFALFRFLYNEYPDIFLIYAAVMLFFNCVMYILFCIAFIWGKVK